MNVSTYGDSHRNNAHKFESCTKILVLFLRFPQSKILALVADMKPVSVAELNGAQKLAAAKNYSSASG
jgi:hypothetical protein